MDDKSGKSDFQQMKEKLRRAVEAMELESLDAKDKKNPLKIKEAEARAAEFATACADELKGSELVIPSTIGIRNNLHTSSFPEFAQRIIGESIL